MSQLYDIEMIIHQQPLSNDDKAKLLFELIAALKWDIEGVSNPDDAKVYLFG